MSTQPTWQPMPDELATLKPPNREDAINALNRRTMIGGRRHDRFEDTVRGKQCASGMYGDEMCREYRRGFNETQEAAIADAMIGCQREYERKLEQKARIEANNAAALEAETATLKVRYMASPGATEADFEKALPELLEAQRRSAALAGLSEHERLVEQMRHNVTI